MGYGPLAECGHMANDVEGGEKNRDYIIQKADIHSFQGPTASFAIPQGVFCTI